MLILFLIKYLFQKCIRLALNKKVARIYISDAISKYVDDIFVFFESEHQALTFFDFLNCQHCNLNFTLEKEYMKQLPVLDVRNTCSGRSITSVYKKSTFT